MTRDVLHAPGAIPTGRPYSPGLATGKLVFISGQLGVDPATGAPVGPGIAEQTRQTIENMRALLAEAGLGLEHVAKTTVFLRRMSDFAQMNEVYAQLFPEPRPARSTIGAELARPELVVEIEAIAVRD